MILCSNPSSKRQDVQPLFTVVVSVVRDEDALMGRIVGDTPYLVKAGRHDPSASPCAHTVQNPSGATGQDRTVWSGREQIGRWNVAKTV